MQFQVAVARGFREKRDSTLRPFRGPGCHDDLRTEACEPFRNEETDAARGAGDDDGLSIELCCIHNELSIQARGHVVGCD